MYQAIDIANHIINESKKKNVFHNHLKIQKILYTIEEYFLREKKQPFFLDTIEKTKHGPIYPDVYRWFKGYGAEPIRSAAHTTPIENELDFYMFLELVTPLKQEKIQLKEQELKIIAYTVEKLSPYSALDLSEKITKELQWYELENKDSKEYNKQKIIDYYSQKTKED